MTQLDRYGLALSSSSEAAVAAYREGVDCVLAAWPGAARAFECAIALDAGFALAHAGRARVHAMYGEMAAARACITTARDLVARTGSERERSHVEVIALGIEGQAARSLAGAFAHADCWPRDAMILALPLGAFGLLAFSGRRDHDQARVDLCERHARHYGGDWWFLAYHGWSLTENGDPGRGRQITARALEARRENANAVHALAHAMFETGAGDEADALIDGWLPGYDRNGLLHAHINWHQALVALERGDAERALAIYVRNIQLGTTTAAPVNAVTDGVSLLWRLQLYGHGVPRELWSEVAAYSEAAFPKAGLAFVDMHMGILQAATGNRAGLDRRIAEIEQRLADGSQPSGPVAAVVSRAARAFVDEDYAACARLLEPSAGEVVRVGGSHAQREMIEDTLLIAWMRCGAVAKARALLDARLHRRPSPRDTRWRDGLAA